MGKKLTQKVVKMMITIFIILGLMFFIPAGTLGYWQAWNYLGILLASMLFILVYLLRHDRPLLERRMKAREKEKSQKIIIKIGTVVYLFLFLLPGLDFRFKWSSVPAALVFVADIFFLIGYYIFFLSLRENSFGARTIEVEKEQKVITTGPYAIVRHPMYSAVTIILGFTPLCLGSYWGLVVWIPLMVIFIYRIRDEEKLLSKQLAGYREYLQKTKYRLIPLIW